MTNEFDNEIDAILKSAVKAGGFDTKVFENHPDADEIAAYAENSVTGNLRHKLTSHFSDCDRCRTILSNTVKLNTEHSEKNPHVAPKTKAAETGKKGALPWYKSIFSTKNLVFGLSAAVLLLVGAFGFFALRQTTNPETATVKDMSTAPSGSNETAQSAEANSSELSKSSPETENGDVSNSEIAQLEPLRSKQITPEKPISKNPQTNGSSVADKGETKGKETVSSSEPTPNVDNIAPPPPAPKGKTESADMEIFESGVPRDTPRRQPGKPSVVAKNRSPVTRQTGGSIDSAEVADGAATTRTVSGKKFERRNGVWYDSAYNGQKTINVKRGSDEYKQADASVKSAGDALSGTVVIISGSKAYRIN
ncbi:MAG: hypothetical protein ACK5NT_03255 [Pyrinomonadaceae bacterium]